jgi:ribonucleotide reductase alpha subunit
MTEIQRLTADPFISAFFDEERWDIKEKPSYTKKRLEHEKASLEDRIKNHSMLITEWKKEVEEIKKKLKELEKV